MTSQMNCKFCGFENSNTPALWGCRHAPKSFWLLTTSHVCDYMHTAYSHICNAQIAAFVNGWFSFMYQNFKCPQLLPTVAHGICSPPPPLFDVHWYHNKSDPNSIARVVRNLFGCCLKSFNWISLFLFIFFGWCVTTVGFGVSECVRLLFVVFIYEGLGFGCSARLFIQPPHNRTNTQFYSIKLWISRTNWNIS